MGAAQSAQRDGGKNAAAEEDDRRNKVDDAEHKKPLQNKDQISKINGKTDDGSVAEVIDHCEDEVAPDDAAETEKPLKDAELQSVKTNPKVSPEAKETGPPEMTNMEVTQKDINENFRRFLETITLKVTPKKNSGENETAKDVPIETNRQESPRPDVEDHISKSEYVELNADLNAAQETVSNDSTIFPTPTDLTSNDIRDNTKEMCGKIKETNVETPPGHTDAEMTSPISEQENKNQEATPEEEPCRSSPCSPDEVIISPIKRFFTTGIFSGLRKKKKPPDDETNDKEPTDTERKTSAETTEQHVQKEKETGLGVETGAKENKTEEEIFDASPAEITDGTKVREKTFEGKSPATEPSTLTVVEPENLNLQDKVKASPIKRLLSGSSFKKLTKKQRCRRASDSKLSESGRLVSDQLTSSPEASESPAQHLTEASGQEDGTWASFRKLVTPKKHMKRLSLPNEATQESRISGSLEEPNIRERDKISDLSAEERKKRKDSSVSWEAVLCGSGRRRSRKTSDSEDEMLQHEKGTNKDSESNHVAESPGSSKEPEELLTTSPQQTESPSDGDGESTWKSLKRLVTPQKKSKDEENMQSSDSDVALDEHSFSIKKLLPGRKKRKSVEKEDRASLDDFAKELALDDEESETPAVVPLSEFDTVEIEVHTQSQADAGSQMTKAGDEAPQKYLLGEPNEPVVFCHSPITETEKGKHEALENLSPTTPSSNDESESAELISKHQQLSDIPEETMTTAASVTEEVVRDDTIAEDVIEITSEAITAPEPLDSTQADETEMISAVSQLTDSLKTSGNATPVPVDSGIKETEVLLQQVVETISMTPKDVPMCLKELSLESKMGSTVLQVQETCLKEEPTILAKHNMPFSTPVNTDLFKLDRKDQFTATTQTETESEVSNTISIESVSDPTEEFVSVKCPGEEVYQDSVSQTEESIKELQSLDKSQPLEECFSAESEESGMTGCCVIAVHQDEVELPKLKDSAAAETDENKKKLKEEVQTLLEKESLITQNVSEQVQREDQCPLPVVVPEWQKLITLPEDKPGSETFTDEPKNRATPFMKINVGQENNSELQADDSNAEQVQLLEVIEGVPPSTLHLKEGRVQSFNMEETSGNLLTQEIVNDEPEKVTEQLTEVNIQPDYELQTDADKPKHVQVLEVLESVQAEEPKKITAPLAELHFKDEAAESERVNVLKVIQGTKLDSEATRAQMLVMEAISEDTMAAKIVKNECEQALDDRSEINVVDELQMDAAQAEHIKSSSQVLQPVQAATLDTEKEIISANLPVSEKPTGEIKKTTVPVTEGTVESENKVKQVEADKPENSQESQVLETVPTGTLESEDGRIQLVRKEVTTEKNVKREPNQTIKDLTEVDTEQEDELQMEATQPENSEAAAAEPKKLTVKTEMQELEKPEQGQAPDILEATSQSGQGGVDLEREVPSQDILTAKIFTDKPKQVEVTSEDPPESQKTIDEFKCTTEPPTENKDDLQVEAAEHEHTQVTEVMKTQQAVTLDPEDKYVRSPKKDIPTAEDFLAGPKQPSSPMEENTESKTDHVQDLDQLPCDTEDVSGTDKTELEVVAQQDQPAEVQNDATNVPECSGPRKDCYI
ncbi:A-kinase anchor protein 12 [Thalassophryne amazonica]|uniref:A-kinase anchor protein 12 n=1 Tax=Thalassophryne amazonica TaxID=390379 RepID=UPI0014713DD0|nr:A-kinase anchor protein 12 [Thalassophryne amazonica]